MTDLSSTSSSYSIFGESTEIRTEVPELLDLIEKEFSCYPTANQVPVCVVRIRETLSPDGWIANNPKTHWTDRQGFLIRTKMADFRWQFLPHQTRIEVALREFSPPVRLLYRGLHRQYSSRSEMIGQILHENVLVPRMLVHPNYALLHASAIVSPTSRKTICIGGTGGGGKTSLMLKACLEEGSSFLADDISVLSSDGLVHPNYAFPKIYGYNLEAFPKLRLKLFGGCSLWDRLHWKLHSLRGSDKVRRRIDPRSLCPECVADHGRQLSDYVLLFRNQNDRFKLEPVSVEIAADATAQVLATEFNTFLNHLSWDRFNRNLATCSAPESNLIFTKSAWSNRLKIALQSCRCWVLRYPARADHHDFLNEGWRSIAPLFNNLKDR